MAERPRMAPGCLTVDVTIGTDVAQIELSGEMDLDTLPQFEEAVRHVLLMPVRIVIVDAKNLTFCDCASLGGLLRANKCITEAPATFHLANPSRALLRLADLTRTRSALGLPPQVPTARTKPAPLKDGEAVGVAP
ncbi:STAS domain-containing protein [Kitasatospora aureofaciens]|uniref:STAS domain-containing protein n=1 Tax=Kitasatospora aureofaciens TaxID=1894 RepID=UPI0036F46B50